MKNVFCQQALKLHDHPELIVTDSALSVQSASKTCEPNLLFIGQWSASDDLTCAR